MTDIMVFTCPHCNNDTWKLSRTRYGDDGVLLSAFLHFECSACGTRPMCIIYGHPVDYIEQLIDLGREEAKVGK